MLQNHTHLAPKMAEYWAVTGAKLLALPFTVQAPIKYWHI
jgi:hypothetical protein